MWNVGKKLRFEFVEFFQCYCLLNDGLFTFLDLIGAFLDFLFEAQLAALQADKPPAAIANNSCQEIILERSKDSVTFDEVASFLGAGNTEIAVYPNPTHSTVQIQSSVEGTFTLTNLLGQPLQQIQVTEAFHSL